jgi:hypothetical protein
MSAKKTLGSVLVAIATALCSVAHAQDILTQRGDNERAGVNLAESQLTHDSVRTRLGKLWILYADARIMAQPLYVNGLTSARCPAGCNTVIFATMKGTVYAYMADQKPTTENDTLVWARYLGPPRHGGYDIDWWATDDPWWGILGTPVIDRARGLLYAVVWNDDHDYRIWALDLASGVPRLGPVVVQGSVGPSQFRPANHLQQRKQRAGLLLERGSLYVAFGGDNPAALAGWLFVYDAQTLALKTVWSPTPGGRNGGIWMSGQGIAADPSGTLYLQSGDGQFRYPSTVAGGLDMASGLYGNSLLKLRLGPAGNQLAVQDFFTPCNQAFLTAHDLDLGSAGPLLLPGNLILGGGKQGLVYLMDRSHLGRFRAGATANPPQQPGCAESSAVLQRFRATTGHLHGTPIYWKGPGDRAWIYLMGEGDNLKAFPFRDRRLKTGALDVKQSTYRPPSPGPPPCAGRPDSWMPGGILSVSSNGQQAGSGIVWTLVPANGDANSYRGVKGMLVAFNAEDVSQELWRSQGADPAHDTRDSFGLLSRFNPPTVANGKVFVPTAGDQEPLRRYDGPGGPCGPRPTQFPPHYALAVYGLR